MIEFPDEDAREDELLERGRPPMRRRTVLALGAGVATVIALAVIVGGDDEGRDRRRAEPSTSRLPLIDRRTFAIDPDAGRPCEVLPGIGERCSFDKTPPVVLTAIRARFPTAKIVSENGGEIGPDGRLLGRQLSLDAGPQKIDISLEDGRANVRPYRVGRLTGATETRLDLDISHHRRLSIAVLDTRGKAVPEAVLQRLAHDSRLLATG